MASIARHYIARAARLSLFPHQPASTIQANSNPSQITVQLLSAAPLQSGMRFPFERRFGKSVPFQANILGCSFRSPPQSESASHYLAENWDALSGRVETESGRSDHLIPVSSPSARACYTSSIYATANGSAPRPPLANEL